MLAPLKLESGDRKSWVEVRPHNNDPGVYSACAMEAVADLGRGRFQGLNGDVFFMRFEKFCDEFDRFILDRSLSPTLEGEYDSYLSFSAEGNRVIFSFCVGDDSAEEAYRLRSSFEIEGERLNGLNDYFRALGQTFSS
ncbi:MAG: hypothetical protein GXP30_14820 [Verrucomicrobia bacterium]|nr:hypothetical protein [Verrucomicrobiota bacterium]